MEQSSARPWWRPFLISLVCVSIGLVILSGLTTAFLQYFGFGITSPVRIFFNVSHERNLPAWWNASLLVSGALLSAGIGVVRNRAKVDSRFGWIGWWAIAAVLGLMSLDEFTGIHERFDGLWRMLFGANPLNTFQWLALGIPVALGVIVVFWLSVRVLPRVTARMFLIGLLVFFAGAIGLESVPAIFDFHLTSVEYAVTYHLEELLEFIGASIMCVAPLTSVAGKHTEQGLLLDFHRSPSQSVYPNG